MNHRLRPPLEHQLIALLHLPLLLIILHLAQLSNFFMKLLQACLNSQCVSPDCIDVFRCLELTMLDDFQITSMSQVIIDCSLQGSQDVLET